MSTSVAGYTLLRKLGAGGQGEVWLARDEERGEDIALKVVSTPGGRSDPLWIALEQEHGTSQLLEHPGILKVGRPVRDGDTALLPMEYAVGGDLRALRGVGYLEIVPVLMEVAQALEYAHQHSIVHRDLKPGNVLRGKGQRILLSDFGLSGGVSPFSASPQQLEGAPPAPSDDIYGLGALAYELLSGYPPYHPHFDLQRAISGPVPPLKSRQSAPAPLIKLIQRMLARNPKDRPGSMRQVIDALDAALNDTLIFDPKQVSVSAAIAANLTLPSPETLRAHALRGRPVEADAAAEPPRVAQAVKAVEPPKVKEPPAPLPAAPKISAPPGPGAPSKREPDAASKVSAPPAPPAPGVAGVAGVSPKVTAPPRPMTALPPLNIQFEEPRFPAIEPVQWHEIRAAQPSTLMRIEPARTSRWAVILFVLLGIGLAAAWSQRAVISHFVNDAGPLAAIVPLVPAPGAASAGPATEAARAADPGESNTALRSQQTNAARAQFEQQLADLNQRAAGVWGGAEFASAQAHAAEGSAALASGDLGIAAPRYKEALALLDIVAKRAPGALAAELASGDQALAAGQGDAARQDFELAGRIDPQNARAERGLKRARGLDGVLPLLADGANAEQARNFPRAVQDYSQALSLDPDNDKAKAGMARANAAFGEDSYARAVGSGFAALGAGRLEQARVAFENARTIRPTGSEAAEGLGRVGAALRARGFASTRSRAASYEVEERWSDALQEYQQALELDPSLAFAQSGRARALARSDLAERIEGMIRHPERLSDGGVRAEATSLLNQARAASPSGPVIRSQTARLESLMSSYDTPVRLALLSDNATQVAIQRVGFFGAFSRREVQLKPGRYTVVGTRAGFRDVRRDVTVAPGQNLQSVNVSCIEPI